MQDLYNTNFKNIKYVIEDDIWHYITDLGDDKISEEKKNVINIKVDMETKAKLETMKFLLNKSSLSDVCKFLIEKGIKDNEDKIKEAEKLRIE